MPKLVFSAAMRQARATHDDRSDVGAVWTVPNKVMLGSGRQLMRQSPVLVSFKKHRHPAYAGPASFA